MNTNKLWQALSQYTEARIGLGKVGVSQPTTAQLKFQLDHARARDAVWTALDCESLAAELSDVGIKSVVLHSQASDRAAYLTRPDLGRQLNPPSVSQLQQMPAAEVVFVVADGLSTIAVQQNAGQMINRLCQLPCLKEKLIAPVVIVEQGRVAVGDAVGELLRAELVIVLVGERPGLSAANSLGMYLTYRPKTGCTDADRNCISNIRPGGLSFDQAATKAGYLIDQFLIRKISGVQIKDNSDERVLDATKQIGSDQ
ncbi:ethanolamine ammonia-lyase subunit EutC [Gynuella sp.]|uniref:ethanolamine ammonia-lyase subunit EutC n=1 Tax=Gynuella sp. TaxID=2969146 RepID=UPI003D0EF088